MVCNAHDAHCCELQGLKPETLSLQMRHFDSGEMLRTLHEYPVTVLCAPPTAYRALVQHRLSQFPFKALKHCVSAGEPLNPEVMHEWTKGTGMA